MTNSNITRSLAQIRVIRASMTHLAAALRAWEMHLLERLPASPKRIKIRRPAGPVETPAAVEDTPEPEQTPPQTPEPEQTAPQTPEPEQTAPQTPPRFKCDECGSAHKSNDLLQYHIAAKHTNKCFKCPQCPFSSPRLTNVYQHAAAKHCKEWLAPFKQTGGKCQHCNKEYKSEPSYKQHCFTCVASLRTLSPEAREFRTQVMNLKCE
jgi:DNA-directed RNA polymerase subunit M/transcription elongation factor TFIIS